MLVPFDGPQKVNNEKRNTLEQEEFEKSEIELSKKERMEDLELSLHWIVQYIQ